MAGGDWIAGVRSRTAAQVEVEVAAADPDGVDVHPGFAGPRPSRCVLHEAVRLRSVEGDRLLPGAHRKVPWEIDRVEHMGTLQLFEISGTVRNCAATLRRGVGRVNGLHSGGVCPEPYLDDQC
ncbi:hypothetical protein SGA01_02190 [Streptomyces gardneri]|uniref:Uncharacterized protein n=1 Tax=Streptomyces gardneri TaxID=66892 RepID=A0A4Y3RAV6_9ACTN|nr:hypothetical protein SGA01_02190 [Streptomyces gardneri]